VNGVQAAESAAAEIANLPLKGDYQGLGGPQENIKSSLLNHSAPN